jgi:hypothetical protein
MGKKSDKEKNKKGKNEKKVGKQAKKQKKDSKKPPTLSPQQRIDMIAEAAYFIAERHGFDPTRTTQDWQEAERQIDDMLNAK